MSVIDVFEDEVTKVDGSISVYIKKVEGCKDVRIYQDINDLNTFLLVEKWQKHRNFDDHMNSSLFAALIGIKGLLNKSPEIKFMVEN